MEGKRNRFIPVIAIPMMVFMNSIDELAAKGWLLPAVGLLVALVFGFIGYLIFKEWRKSDEDVLINPGTMTRLTLGQKGGVLVSTIVFSAYVLLVEKAPLMPGLLICGIVVAVAGGSFLAAYIQKLRGREGEPLFPNARLQPLQIIHMLFGLAATGFACFWCYMMITKGIWWMSFPGFIIGAGTARPFVAGVRILLGGKGSRKPKREIEPWDRPDKEY